MADGTITIDVDIPTGKVKSDVQAINEEVNRIGNKAGNKLDENLEKNFNKAKSKASQTSKNIDRELGKDHKTKVTVEDSEAKRKASELKSDLNKLPKDHKVKINAETGETTEKVDSVKHKINQLPEKHNTEINATDHTGGVFARIKSHFDGINERGEKTHSLFKTIFSANVISNAATSAFGAVKGALGGMYQEAKQYALEQQTMNATWLTLTNSASKGQAMVKQINNMAVAAQNSTEMVDQLSQKFYAINNNAKQTGELTKSILTLQDAFGQTDAAVENFGTQFSQMMANGKVSAQDMMSIVNTFPKLRPMLLDYERRIHHSSHMTMQEMNKMMSDGKIKSQDMINVVLEAGKKFNKATGNFTKTIPGMTRVVKSQMPVLLGAFTKPLAKMESPVYAAVAKWVSSKKTNKEFQNLGKTVSTGMNNVMKAFSGDKAVNVTKALDNAINGINKGLKGVFGWISGHAKDLKTIASSIASIGGQIAKAVWKDFASIITTIGNMFGLTAKNGKSSSGAIHVIAEFLDHLAKNKLAIQAISKAIVAMAVVKGLDKVGGDLFAIGEKGYGAYKKLKALRGGMKGLKLAEDASKGEKAWFKFGKRLSSLPGIAKKAAEGIKKAMNFSMGKRLAVGAVSGAAVAAPEIVNAVKNRHNASARSQDIGGAVGALAGGTLTSMIPVVGPMLAPVGAIIGKYAGRWGGQAVNNFTKGWQRNKPPKKFWSLENLGWSAHSMWNGFTRSVSKTIKWLKNNWREIGSFLTHPVLESIRLLSKNKGFQKWVKKTANDMHKGWKQGVEKSHKVMAKFWSNTAKGWNKMWKSINSNRYVKAFKKGKFFSTALKDMKSRFSAFNKWLSQKWSSTWREVNSNRYVKAFKKGKFFSTALKDIRSRWNSFTSWFGKNWHNFWRSTNKHAHSSWSDTVKNWHSFTKSINTGWKSFKDSFKSSWNGFWHGLENTVKSWGKTIKDDFTGTVNNIIGGFNDVVHALGGKKKTIGFLHFATGTDWRKRWGTPAILNDGTDSPATHNRESIIHGNGTWELLPDIPFLKRYLLPTDDVVNARDTARIAASFGNAVHFASGSVSVDSPFYGIKDSINRIYRVSLNAETLAKAEAIRKRKRDAENDRRHKKNDKDKAKLSSKKKSKNHKQLKITVDDKKHKGDVLVDKALLTGGLKETGKETWVNEKLFNRLMSYTKAKPIKISKHSRIRYRAIPVKRDGKDYLVDSHWLTGGKSNTGKLEKITREGFLKLLQFTKKERKYKLPKKKRKKTKRRKERTTRRSESTSSRRRTSRRSYSSERSYSTGSRSVSGGLASVAARVSGLSSVTSLAKAIKSVTGTHKSTIKVSYSGTYKAKKSIDRLIKSVGKLRRVKSPHLNVKYSGTFKAKKSFDRLTKSIKGTSKRFRSLKSASRSASSGLKSIRSASRSASSSVKTLGSHTVTLRKRVESLYKAIKNDKFGTVIKKQAEEAVKSLEGKGNFAKTFEKLTNSAEKSLKKMCTEAEKEFKSMWNTLKKESTSGESNIEHGLNSFESKFRGQFRSIDSGVTSIFSRFWRSMKSTARNGLDGVIDVLNSAIGKIDNVIGQFGGSKSAVHKVTRLATGTGALGGVRRPIVAPTLAILNDGNDSPETGNKEAVWDRNTGNVDVVQGRFTPRILKPGQEVFNATETKMLGYTSPQHFASGTGALKQLYELAKKNWNHPQKTGQALFADITGLKGAINDLAQGMKSKGEDQGVKWWSQLWKMVENKVNDDDLGLASGLLKAVEKLGDGDTYSQSKRMQKFYDDCSSLVSKALKKYYGANWAVPNGWALTVSGLWQHAHRIPRSEAKPGDPIFWLPNTHVGVYAGHGRYYSAYGNGTTEGGPVGMQRVAPGATFARFNGLDTTSDKDKDKDVKVKANNKLQRFIKPQVGKGFWSTIQKIADKFGESGQYGNPAGGDIGRWEPIIKKALEANHLTATDWRVRDMLRLVARESTGDPRAVNNYDINAQRGDPSKGVAQITGSNFKTYHFKGHDNIFNGYDNLLAAINYIIHRYGTSRAVFDRVAASAYGHGGIVSKHQIAEIAEGGHPESIIPWDPAYRGRAYQIMQATLDQFKAQDGKSQLFQNKAQQAVDLTKTNAEIEAINDKFDQALVALGILTSQNDVIQVNNYLDKNKIGEAMFSVMKRLNMRSTRNSRYNISGH